LAGSPACDSTPVAGLVIVKGKLIVIFMLLCFVLWLLARFDP
jgi:hypothetical protein